MLFRIVFVQYTLCSALGYLVATFWEIAAYLVSHFCKLYFDCVILVISRSDFKCGIWLLIAPVAFHSFLVTFNYIL